MPDTTYLQIEGADTDASRVVELPGAAIRVGRGHDCEVRLTDPELAEVQCLLRRRGKTWHVQPIGPAGLVSLAGQAVDQLRPLPFDEPLRVGSFRLSIRHEGGDRFHSPFEVGSSAEVRAQVLPDDAPARSTQGAGRDDSDADRLHRWQARVELRERWVQSRQEEKKWEARWRAAGEGLRARGSSPQVRRTPDEPVRSEGGSLAGTDRPALPRQPGRPTARSVPPLLSPPVVTPPETKVAPNEHRRAATVAEPADASSLPTDRDSVRCVPVLPKQSEAEPDDPVSRLSRGLRVPPTDPESRPAPGPSIPPIDVSPSREEGRTQPSPMGVTETDRSFDQGASASSRQQKLGHNAEAPAHGAIAPTNAGPRERVEFREAAAIMAAQGRRVVQEPAAQPRARRKTANYGFPTDPAPPAQWSVPAWVALPLGGVAALALVATGLMLAAGWAMDNLSAGLAARAALRAEGAKLVALDPTERVETRWWRTTAGHLALWSAAIERSPDVATRVDEVRDALDAARRAAPLESATRYATARKVAGWESPSPVAALGLTRDVASLTLTGRTLKAAGKTEASLRAYRRALELAAGADASRLTPPAFDDDPQIRRFRLPHEAIVGGVIRDMIEAADWNFAAWSQALPRSAVIRLTAARILREKGDADAERALALVLADDLAPAGSAALAAEELAARAEALALNERRPEAAERYREAIATAADDATRRRWRLSLAEILAPLGEATERAAMLEAAKATDPTDEVTRKAVEAQQFAGLK